MKKATLAALLLMFSAGHTPAAAEITELNGKFSEPNVIRVTARVRLPAPEAMAYQVAMLKVASMAGEKGYIRFAVVKIDDCGTLSINGSPIVQTCKIFGQVLSPGETAQPKGKDAPKYYNIFRRNDGMFIPTLEHNI
jgi:hypothetical protein